MDLHAPAPRGRLASLAHIWRNRDQLRSRSPRPVQFVSSPINSFASILLLDPPAQGATQMSMDQVSRSSSTTTSLVAAAAAALSITVAAASLYKRRKLSNSNESSLRYPPTPPSQHWLFGHALALQPDPTKPKVSHDILFQRWMQKLNSKVVMFQLPVIGRLICVGDPTVPRHVLMTTSFRKSPTYGGMVPLIG